MNQFESGSVGRNFNEDDGFGVTQVILTASVVLTPLAYIKVATANFLYRNSQRNKMHAMPALIMCL